MLLHPGFHREPRTELLQTPYMDFRSRFMAGNRREGRGRREVRGRESRGMEGRRVKSGRNLGRGGEKRKGSDVP